MTHHHKSRTGAKRLIGSILAIGLTGSFAGTMAQETGAQVAAENSGCEFSFVPGEQGGRSPDGQAPVKLIRISPACQLFYFPGKSEHQLATDLELWNHTGDQSHFRIAGDGALVFMPQRITPASGSPPPSTTSRETVAAKDATSRAPQTMELDDSVAVSRISAAQVAALATTLEIENQALQWRRGLETLRSENVQLSTRLADAEAAEVAARDRIAALSKSLAAEQAKTTELTHTRARLAAAESKLAAQSADLANEKAKNAELTRMNAILADAEAAAAAAEDKIAALSAALEAEQARTTELNRTLEARADSPSPAAVAGLKQELAHARARIASLEQPAPCADDSDNDGVPDDRDRCAETPAGYATDPVGCVRVELPGVEFATGSSVLDRTAKRLLDHAAGLLQALETPLEVQGHTDDVGAPETNQHLSQARAEAVKAYLVELGIPERLLTAKGYGEQLPIADNATATGRARNRRVELADIR